jgi:hypothetical protein
MKTVGMVNDQPFGRRAVSYYRHVKLASHLAIEISTVRHQYYPTGDAGTNDGRHVCTNCAAGGKAWLINHYHTKVRE